MVINLYYYSIMASDKELPFSKEMNIKTQNFQLGLSVIESEFDLPENSLSDNITLVYFDMEHTLNTELYTNMLNPMISYKNIPEDIEQLIHRLYMEIFKPV